MLGSCAVVLHSTAYYLVAKVSNTPVLVHASSDGTPINRKVRVQVGSSSGGVGRRKGKGSIQEFLVQVADFRRVDAVLGPHGRLLAGPFATDFWQGSIGTACCWADLLAMAEEGRPHWHPASPLLLRQGWLLSLGAVVLPSPLPLQ